MSESLLLSFVSSKALKKKPQVVHCNISLEIFHCKEKMHLKHSLPRNMNEALNVQTL